MEKMVLKKRLVEACFSMQEESVTTAKSAMDEAQASANEYGPPKDRYDSFRTQLLRKRDLFAQQYQRALDELNILKKIDFTTLQSSVSVGSVVITDQAKMFVSIGLGKFEMDGEIWFAISPLVPLFKVINGLKAGDEYSFNNQQFKIIDVF